MEEIKIDEQQVTDFAWLEPTTLQSRKLLHVKDVIDEGISASLQSFQQHTRSPMPANLSWDVTPIPNLTETSPSTKDKLMSLLERDHRRKERLCDAPQ